jgi:hypothetical protein
METLLINALATFAIANTITKERGPFAIFSRLQTWLELKLPSQPSAPTVEDSAEEWTEYQQSYAKYLADVEKFYSTMWGYAYALSSCQICLGAYSAAFVVLWQGGGLVDWLAAYGGHLILLKIIKE